MAYLARKSRLRCKNKSMGRPCQEAEKELPDLKGKIFLANSFASPKDIVMCLAIPARIEELKDEQKAIVAIENFTPENAAAVMAGEQAAVTRLRISTSLLPQEPQVGDYVLVHAGFAIDRIDQAEAEDTLLLLRQMAGMQEIKQ